MTVYDPPVGKCVILVRALLGDPSLLVSLQIVAGHAGLDRTLAHPRVQKSGLALAGHLHGVVASRVQLFGETELSYLATLSTERQREVVMKLYELGLSCVVLSRGARPPAVLVEASERTGTPLLVCDERSSIAITALHTFLDDRLAPRARVHGVLVDVFEVGVLLLGASGIGKSEAALELVARGHRLVADDVVEVDFRPPGLVFGQAVDLLRHHMEVRGLGILDIRQLYGVTAVRERKRIDLVIQLEAFREDAQYDRIGLDDRFRELLGVRLRELLLPVRPGRNMSAIIEIAARHELVRQAGHNPAKELVARAEARIERRQEPREQLTSSNPPESMHPLGWRRQ